MATTASETQVQELYIAYFGRPADPAGLAFYADALDAATTTINDIAASFAVSTEAAATVALSTDAYLAAVYLQAFGRAYVEGTDGTFWKDAINNAATTKELAMVQILNGASGTDATAVTNKVTVAKTYTAAVTADSKDYSGTTAAASAKAVLDGVTDDAATVTSGNTAAQTSVDGLSNAGAGVGSSFALTTSATDIIAGTALDDTITGDATTFQSGDLIVDTTTTDNDTLNIALTAANAAQPTVSGIENINFNVTSFAAIDVDADGIRGGAITVNQLQTAGGTSATVDDVDGSQDTTVKAGTGVTGTLTVNFDTGGSSVDGGSATTVTVTESNTGATAGDATSITANSATTINASGIDLDGTTVISGKAGTTASQIAINLDGTTALTDSAAISANGVVDLDLEVTGGDDVEIIDFSGNGAAATFNLVGDELIEEVTFSGNQDVTLVGLAAQFSGEKFTDSTTAGTTTLSLITTAAAIDIDTDATIDVLSLNVNMAGNQIDVASGQAITVAVTDGTGLDVNAATASAATNAIALTVDDGLAAVNTINFGTVDITNIKTVSIVANDNLTSTAGSYGATTAVTVSGAGAVSFSSTAASLDAGSLTGVLTSTASANLTTITGGSGDDVITAYAGAMTIDGGAGTDTLTIDATIDYTTAAVALSNIEVLLMDSSNNGTETVSIFGSDVTGQSFIVKSGGTTSIDTLEIELDSASIDVSSLVVDTTTAKVDFDMSGVATIATTITGTNGVDSVSNEGTGAITMTAGAGDDLINVSGGTAAHNISGEAGDDTLTGGAGAETLNGGIGDDIIIAGAGNDTITGGEGIDTITTTAGTNTVDLAETTAAVDEVNFVAGTATITGFTTTSDNLDFDGLTIAGGGALTGGATTATAVTSGSVTAGALTDDTVYVITDGATALTAAGTESIADYTNTTDVAAFLAEGYTTTADNDAAVFLINDLAADKTYAYLVDETTGGASTIQAADVTLIGTITETNGAALVIADVI